MFLKWDVVIWEVLLSFSVEAIFEDSLFVDGEKFGEPEYVEKTLVVELLDGCVSDKAWENELFVEVCFVVSDWNVTRWSFVVVSLKRIMTELEGTVDKYVSVVCFSEEALTDEESVDACFDSLFVDDSGLEVVISLIDDENDDVLNPVVRNEVEEEVCSFFVVIVVTEIGMELAVVFGTFVCFADEWTDRGFVEGWMVTLDSDMDGWEESVDNLESDVVVLLIDAETILEKDVIVSVAFDLSVVE